MNSQKTISKFLLPISWKCILKDTVYVLVFTTLVPFLLAAFIFFIGFLLIQVLVNYGTELHALGMLDFFPERPVNIQQTLPAMLILVYLLLYVVYVFAFCRISRPESGNILGHLLAVACIVFSVGVILVFAIFRTFESWFVEFALILSSMSTAYLLSKRKPLQEVNNDHQP